MTALINLDAARPAVSGAPSLGCWLYHTTVTPHVLARKGQIAVAIKRKQNGSRSNPQGTSYVYKEHNIRWDHLFVFHFIIYIHIPKDPTYLFKEHTIR